MARNILIAGFPRRELLRAARDLGLDAYVMPDGVDRGGPDESYHVVDGEVTSVDDVLRAASDCDPVGVLAASERAVVAVAQAASKLGLHSVSPWAATRTRNKVALRQALATKGLPNPIYREAVDAEEAEGAAKAIGLPVIIKPVDGYAGLGVRRVDHLEDVSLAFLQAQRHSRHGVVIIESYLKGTEYSVEGIKVDGEFHVFGIAERTRGESVHQCPAAASMPAEVGASAQGALMAMARASLTAIGMMSGPAHVEFIMTETGPYVIEIGAYTGAARIESALIHLSTGVDLLRASLQVATGDVFAARTLRSDGAAASWIEARPGVVAAIEGIEEAERVPGVVRVQVGVQPGDEVGHVTDCISRDRIGHVLATGRTAPEALEAAKQACAHCRVVTTPVR